ncbi:MAG: AlpA family transcriptional regulator [Gammaproteobacteria bacterium]|nr:AlpA family transcriptional regulator [Gammaproteobacteria bacterium]MDH5591565.1 AlpA family transcriptional regulator [Gammaproteobacteria bacterium]
MSERIIRLSEVVNKIGLGKSTIYKMIFEGSFPKQIKLGARSAGWLESEIDDWIRLRVKLSRNENPE